MQVDRIDPGFGNWLAGFMDGEGCFYIQKKRLAGYWGYSTGARISLRRDDKAILQEVRDTIGIGAVYDEKRVRRPGNEKPKALWVVTRRSECVEMVALFRRFPLRAKKARDFEVWSEAVALWSSRNWQRGWTGEGPADWSGMEALHEQMRGVRKYREKEECLPQSPFKDCQSSARLFEVSIP